MRAGANGYIMKQEATEKVLVAIRSILQGKVYLSDRLTNTMLRQYVRGAAPTRVSSREPHGPGAGSVSLDRRRAWNSPDC